jgi:hypothetical protein
VSESERPGGCTGIMNIPRRMGGRSFSAAGILGHFWVA